MPIQTIPATDQQPLILVTNTSKDRFTAIKYWHTSNLGEIWSSTYKFLKTPLSVQWSTPKRVTPKNATVSILQYNPQTNSCTIEFILDSLKIASRNHLPMTMEEYAAFALNPAHQFSHPQAHTIYLQLRSWLPQDQFAQFLQLHPDADKEEPTAIPSFATQPFYPSTIRQAFALVNPSSQTATTSQASVTNTPNNPPTLTFVPQPTTPILIPNLQATNFRLPKSKPLPPQNCYVFLRVIQAGPQNRRREVFYAYPSTATVEHAFPISPLKSTVAILYCDTNPNSSTFNQPIIKSINVAASMGTELEIFINEHGANLSPTQLLHCTHGASPTHHNHTQQDNTMQTNQCKFCGSDFEAPNAKTLYCSPKCRIDYNAGKTFGAEAKRSGRPSKQATTQPSDAVTQEQFQALSAQVAQLVQILTPK